MTTTRKAVLEFLSDVVQINNPLNSWGRNDRYKRSVHYVRIAAISSIFLLVTALAMKFSNIRHDHYLEQCLTAEHNYAECELRWLELEQSRQRQ